MTAVQQCVEHMKQNFGLGEFTKDPETNPAYGKVEGVHYILSSFDKETREEAKRLLREEFGSDAV